MDGFSNLAMERLEAQVLEAISWLDDDLVLEYKQAVEHDADLVLRETHIASFLQAEQHHTLRAAKRIAAWWKVRKELFGHDQWLKPMIATGTGALDAAAVECLRTGFNMICFPKISEQSTQQQTQQQQQLPAAYVSNRGRLPPHAEHMDSLFLLQVAFYLLTIHGPALLEQAKGEIAVLHVVDSQSTTKVDLFDKVNYTRRMLQCVPVCIKSVTVVRCFEPPETLPLASYLGFKQAGHAKLTFDYAVKAGTTVYVAENSFESTTMALLQRGLHSSVLPAQLGGDIDYATRVPEWIRQQMSMESFGVSPVRNMELVHQVARAFSVPQRNMELVQAAVVAEPVRRGRRRRRNAAEMTTPTSTTTLKEEQKDEAMVVERRPSESEEEFIKRRNRIYGRRHAQREQEAIDETYQNIERLRQVHEEWLRENRRLQDLLTAANAIVAACLSSNDSSNGSTADVAE